MGRHTSSPSKGVSSLVDHDSPHSKGVVKDEVHASVGECKIVGDNDVIDYYSLLYKSVMKDKVVSASQDCSSIIMTHSSYIPPGLCPSK